LSKTDWSQKTELGNFADNMNIALRLLYSRIIICRKNLA